MNISKIIHVRKILNQNTKRSGKIVFSKNWDGGYYYDANTSHENKYQIDCQIDFVTLVEVKELMQKEIDRHNSYYD